MTRQEQIQNLAKIARISVSYAEDLYDSFFPKPVVPQCVADWYEENKHDLDGNIYRYIKYLVKEDRSSEFYEWFDDVREVIKNEQSNQ